MKEVKLIFPDNATMAEFVVRERVSSADVNTPELTLTVMLPDNKIAAAEKIYGAILKNMIPKN